ncbi:MAG TPA: hypothetical protein VH704_07065 [Casimicrobiaceae bacterium]|jgi:uncharacterized protein YceK|nr:hypothetical protein [Casimicrobiaceae bacterium]
MKLILALSVIALASGCSTVPTQQQQAQNAVVSPSSTCDYSRMQTIDRVAQARGVYVEWVHCPMAKRDRT